MSRFFFVFAWFISLQLRQRCVNSEMLSSGSGSESTTAEED